MSPMRLPLPPARMTLPTSIRPFLSHFLPQGLVLKRCCSAGGTVGSARPFTTCGVHLWAMQERLRMWDLSLDKATQMETELSHESAELLPPDEIDLHRTALLLDVDGTLLEIA